MFFNNKTVVDETGNLTPIEQSKDVPFEIQRIFYVYGVRSENLRGKHAHHKTKQLLVCLNGKIDVICKDGINEVRYLLESPQQAVLIPEMIWDEQIYRSEDSVYFQFVVLIMIKRLHQQFSKYKKLRGIV